MDYSTCLLTSPFSFVPLVSYIHALVAFRIKELVVGICYDCFCDGKF